VTVLSQTALSSSREFIYFLTLMSQASPYQLLVPRTLLGPCWTRISSFSCPTHQRIYVRKSLVLIQALLFTRKLNSHPNPFFVTSTLYMLHNILLRLPPFLFFPFFFIRWKFHPSFWFSPLYLTCLFFLFRTCFCSSATPHIVPLAYLISFQLQSFYFFHYTQTLH